jgi:exonuclease SbcD
MIRVLHTGDWHIGQTLRGYSREYEHTHVLRQLVKIVAEQQVDVLIVAGDIFDSQNPSGESQSLFYETIERLHRARPEMSTIIIAGNHDAAGRLEAPHPLLARFKVNVVGSVRRVDGRVLTDRHHLALKDASGEVFLHVLAVSYPTATCLRNLTRLEYDANPLAGSPIVRQVKELYDELHESVQPKLAGVPLIVTGHLHVAGGELSEGSERPILMGGEHAVPSSIFPAEATYVALGHLHKSQFVGRESIRYSGSLIPLSSTEQLYAHSVTLLTLGGGEVLCTKIPLERPVLFLRLPGHGEVTLSDLPDQLAQLLSSAGIDADCEAHLRPFLHIRLSRSGLPSTWREKLQEIAGGLPVRIVDARPQALPVLGTVQASAPGGSSILADRNPEDLFRQAFLKYRGTPPGASHLEIFHRVRAEIAP